MATSLGKRLWEDRAPWGIRDPAVRDPAGLDPLTSRPSCRRDMHAPVSVHVELGERDRPANASWPHDHRVTRLPLPGYARAHRFKGVCKSVDRASSCDQPTSFGDPFMNCFEQAPPGGADPTAPRRNGKLARIWKSRGQGGVMHNLRSALHRRSRRDQSRGQALVELAIISVVLLLILGTVLDLGRLFYAQITVENAARAGVLVAAREPTSYTGACPAGAPPANKIGCAIAAESRGSGVTVQASEVTVSCETTSGSAINPCPASPLLGARSRVGISKTFTFLMPILSAVLGSNLTVSASVAADQQFLPPAATFIPAPSASASAAPSASPAPSSSAAPCVTGFAPMPDLVVGATGGTETVAQARLEWATAGFDPNRFSPSSGSTNRTVTGQGALVPGTCYNVASNSVIVAYT